jgi:hypothetical protein
MHTQPLQVHWVKSGDGEFLDLLRLNLNPDSAYFLSPKFGVYVIWSTGTSNAPVLTVGQGNIRDRLMSLRLNPLIKQFSESGQIKVSWVLPTNPDDFDGVEAYLYDYYKPLVGERKRGVSPIPVTPLLSL